MINGVNLVGLVLRVNIPERYRNDPRYSPVLMIQYGPRREMKRGQNVHFLNAVPVKVIGPKWQLIKDEIHEGALVSIQGHLQGIVREEDEFRKPGIEIVADRIDRIEFHSVDIADSVTGQTISGQLPSVVNVSRRARDAAREVASREATTPSTAVAEEAAPATAPDAGLSADAGHGE